RETSNMNMRLEPTPRWSPNLTVPAVAALVWGALIVANVVVQTVTGHEVALCWFRRITGLACPSCGGTRLAIAIATGDWGAAVTLNPLLLALGVWLLVLAVLRLGFGRKLM